MFKPKGYMQLAFFSFLLRNTVYKHNCVFTRKSCRLRLPEYLFVLYNVTYTVPQRFKCPACLHTVQTTDRKNHRGSTKSPNHFGVPSISEQTSKVLCSELTEFLSAQWQDISLSSVYQSVSCLCSTSSPPLSS